ncbi:hypothetical protein BDQ17DRAFT_1364185 [Cyathus striatus]|nr:hypothetical protein BDQ17DRAFT_1364185 [Cyathus striatus]
MSYRHQLPPLDIPQLQHMPSESPPRLPRNRTVSLPAVGPPVNIHELLMKRDSEPSPIIFDITNLSSFARLDVTIAFGLQGDTWRCQYATVPPSREVVMISKSLYMDVPPIFARPLRGDYVTIWDVLCAVHCTFSPVRNVPHCLWDGLSLSTDAAGVWVLHLR